MIPITLQTIRAAWMRQDVDTVRHAVRGDAWRVPGAPTSAFYVFRPDGDAADRPAIFCDGDDLMFEEEADPNENADRIDGLDEPMMGSIDAEASPDFDEDPIDWREDSTL